MKIGLDTGPGIWYITQAPLREGSGNLENDTEREANKRQLILTRVLSKREEKAFEEEGGSVERR